MSRATFPQTVPESAPLAPVPGSSDPVASVPNPHSGPTVEYRRRVTACLLPTVGVHRRMSENKRFVVAVHALTALAMTEGETASSDDIAWSANMNAAAVRRVLSRLRDAGLVRSKPGPSGGFALDRAPEDITLLDVYSAVGLDTPFEADRNEPNPECPIGGNIRPALRRAFAPVEDAMFDALADVSVADVVEDVRGRIEAGDDGRHSRDADLL